MVEALVWPLIIVEGKVKIQAVMQGGYGLVVNEIKGARMTKGLESRAKATPGAVSL